MSKGTITNIRASVLARLKNLSRLRSQDQRLKSLGWNVIIVWECELNNKNNLDEIVKEIRGESTAIDAPGRNKDA